MHLYTFCKLFTCFSVEGLLDSVSILGHKLIFVGFYLNMLWCACVEWLEKKNKFSVIYSTVFAIRSIFAMAATVFFKERGRKKIFQTAIFAIKPLFAINVTYSLGLANFFNKLPQNGFIRSLSALTGCRVTWHHWVRPKNKKIISV